MLEGDGGSGLCSLRYLYVFPVDAGRPEPGPAMLMVAQSILALPCPSSSASLHYLKSESGYGANSNRQ